MFKTEHGKNTVLTWVLRLVGFLAMWIGLFIGLNPLKVLADAIGIVGDLVGMGLFLVTGLVAVVLSLFTIATAWLFYRPVLGIGLMLVAAAGVWWFNRLRKKGHERFAARRQHATGGMPGPGMMPFPVPPGMAVAGADAPLPPLPPVPGAMPQGMPPVPGR